MRPEKLKEYQKHVEFVLGVLDIFKVAASFSVLEKLNRRSVVSMASEASKRLLLVDGIVREARGGNGGG